MEITAGPFSLEALMSLLENRSADELGTLSVNGLPPLHYLATAPSNAFGGDRLDRLIKHFKTSGYDLNQQNEKYFSFGFTPLVVGIVKRNLLFVESLLRNGARLDVCDQEGCSPLHWAAIMNDFTIFRRLIHAGALPPSNKQEVSDDICPIPILHTVVDHSSLELADYLLRKDLVDPNEEAIYKGYLPRCLLERPNIIAAMKTFRIKRFAVDASTNLALIRRFPPDQAFAKLPTWQMLPHSALESITTRFTPLARAIRRRRVPVVQSLLEHGAKISGSSEVHYCILHGLMDIAALLKDQISGLDLSNDKIEGMWALHCINEKAYLTQILSTCDVIDGYKEAGWDLNSVGKCVNYFQKIGGFQVDPSTEYSLLHIACYFESYVVIKHLVEKGAGVNSKTNGRDILCPLQISILREDWRSMEYLMANGADVYAIGSFGSPSNDSKMEFTSIDLLMKAPFCKAALIDNDWKLISKVIQQLCSLETVKIDDLAWLPVRDEINGRTINVPSVYWVLQQSAKSREDNRDELTKLVEMMGGKGYDFTLKCPQGPQKPLVFFILENEKTNHYWAKRDLPLLENLLKFDKVALNVRNSEGLNPVEYVLQKWFCRWTCDVRRKAAALKMLIESGVSVSKVMIGGNFNYFEGFSPVIKTLCSVGASVQPRLFVASVAVDENWVMKNRLVREELEELIRWKEEFDKDRKLTLKHLCVLQVREMLGTVGALRMLDGEIPATLKEEVAGLV